MSSRLVRAPQQNLVTEKQNKTSQTRKKKKQQNSNRKQMAFVAGVVGLNVARGYCLPLAF